MDSKIYKQAGFTHRVHYSKKFISGLLQGLTTDCFIHYASENEALRNAVEMTVNNPCCGSSGYIRTPLKIEEI